MKTEPFVLKYLLRLIFKVLFIVFISVYSHVCVQVATKARRGHQLPWRCKTGICESSNMDVGNQTLVPWESNSHS